MKRILPLILILTVFLLLMGMGEMGGTPAGKVPAPEKNFKARVTDREGVQTSLSEFSQDGKAFLAGKRGDATVTVPFEKIAQAEFLPQQGNWIQARVTLRGQGSVEINIDKQAKFYGKADFGTFQILAKDLKAVNFPP